MVLSCFIIFILLLFSSSLVTYSGGRIVEALSNCVIVFFFFFSPYVYGGPGSEWVGGLLSSHWDPLVPLGRLWGDGLLVV